MLRRLQRTTVTSLFVLWLVLSILVIVVALGNVHYLAAIFIGLIITIAVALAIPRVTNRPLSKVAETAEKIAEGDLSKSLRIHDSDEVGKLAQSFNQMAQRLRGTLDLVTAEKNRMHAILNSMADGVIAVDADNRVILINPVVEDVFGLDEDTSLGKTVLEVVRDYELERLFSKALDSGRPTQKELRILTPEPRIFRVHITPLRGEQRGIVALFHDITERRNLEKMRTEFVANASHELRTPLTSVRGFVETLRNGVLEKEPEKAREFLQIIDEETKRISDLVDDMLQLATIEEHEDTLPSESVDLKEVIERAVEIYHPQAQQKNLTIKTELAPGLPTIPGDEHLLSQVFINLIDNAVKYTEEGEIEVGAYQEGNRLIVTVADTGKGIAPKHLSRIFERFFRVDKSRSSEFGSSTGLGLSIVKHVVEKHGGEVSVSSKPAEGTVFTVILPVNTNLTIL